ncbi:hypothetical protein AAKU55_003373 [Oxalobacteraceae bacterium GrIS 1.11]
MSNPLVGPDLANAVAARLEAGQMLCYSHPEYCGMGLRHTDGVFLYGEVQDGEMMSQSQSLQAGADRGQLLAFASRAQFVAWLAAQSDLSLSGRELPQEWLRENQRLTLERLRAFAVA